MTTSDPSPLRAGDPATETAAAGSATAAQLAAPPPPELAPALASFEAGDFRSTQRAVNALIAAAPSPEIVAAATALRGRLAADPWAVRAAALAVGLLALVTVAYLF